MMKLTDASLHQKTARLDANDRPFKLVADHLQIIHYAFDQTPTPCVTATCAYVTAQGERISGLQTQFRIEGERLEYLLMPKESEKGRKAGYFRIEDIEECIMHFGDFPGAEFKGKLALVN